MKEKRISKLQKWYLNHCDGDWEHSYGIKIETLDNPGWSLEINLEGTELRDKPFSEFEHRYDDETDWLRCWKEGNFFKGACGPENLDMMIEMFLKFAES